MNNSNVREWGRENEMLPYELRYLDNLIRHRINQYTDDEYDMDDLDLNLHEWQLPLRDYVQKNKLSNDEAVLLLIALAPHIKPDLFDNAIYAVLKDNTDFPVIGGVKGRNCRMFLPTGETALFLVADGNLGRRLELQRLFGAENYFWEHKILWLEDMQNGEPSMHGRLVISPDYVDLLTYGNHRSPQFSISFPAHKISPSKEPGNYTWDSLVIPDEVEQQIDDIKNWLLYNPELMSRYGMNSKLKPGYRTLFYGPPGTGKTFTAQILGDELKKEVYRIDLSMVVSKYIGETEKNLELLFARAEDKGWILFFDEADALFGKRTNVKDSHDKYANQEVSYLLQRIEDYNGLVILATNMKNNIDDAFKRRFNSMLSFPFPDTPSREKIWRKAFPANAVFLEKPQEEMPEPVGDCAPPPPGKMDIPSAVKKYELSGGSIMNVVHYACIKAVERMNTMPAPVLAREAVMADGDHPPVKQAPMHPRLGTPDEKLVIYLSDVREGIRKEMLKEGKPYAGAM